MSAAQPRLVRTASELESVANGAKKIFAFVPFGHSDGEVIGDYLQVSKKEFVKLVTTILPKNHRVLNCIVENIEQTKSGHSYNLYFGY